METPHISLSSPRLSDAGEDPWDERVQAGCLQGAAKQPLVFSNPREHYHALRDAWARQILWETAIPEQLANHPLGKTFQPSLALIQKKGPPQVPSLFLCGAALSEMGYSWKEGRIPHLAESCQLALLWAIQGKIEEAQKISAWIAGFIQEKPFFSLWCREKEYNVEEGLLSFSLLCRALGKKEEAAAYLKQVSTPVDPFYLALAKLAPKISSVEKKDEWADPHLGLGCLRTPEKSVALVLSGSATSLGAFSKKDVEIRAMGPQGLPLSTADRFGIERLSDGGFLTGWTRLHAYPETWMHLKADLREGNFHLKFMGLKAEEPLAFVFYIKAASCTIGSQVFKPKNLHRYWGDAHSFIFQGRESQIKIETSSPHKAQLIPLAGSGGFWDTDFLLSLEIQPFEAQAHFSIS